MFPRRKAFRSVVCAILSVLVFIHTTPLYAQDSGSSGTSASSSASQASPQTAGASGSGDAGPGGEPGLSAQGPTMFSSTGAAVYSIPIDVPKGRAGIAPNLAISYNSYQGDGWIGQGFLLDMGAIQRSTQTQGGLSYSANNFVATANGSVSNLVANPNWGSNHFENEIDGAFLNYYYNSSTGGWEVRDKSGTLYKYGSSSASRQQNQYGTFKWLLDTVQDLNGNYMTVTYSQDQGQVYLSEIDYTGNTSGLGTTNKITFTLASRNDQFVSFLSNSAVTTAKRLQNDQRLRKRATRQGIPVELCLQLLVGPLDPELCNPVWKRRNQHDATRNFFVARQYSRSWVRVDSRCV